MNLVQVTEDLEIKPFDCGDAGLNGFLVEDAKPFLEKKIGNAFLLNFNCIEFDIIKSQAGLNSYRLSGYAYSPPFSTRKRFGG